MRLKLAMLVVFITALVTCSQAAPSDKDDDNPLKKLTALLGKWKTQGFFANGDKVTSELECRWSPQEEYLICEQRVKVASGHGHQLTVYSYNAKDHIYNFTTFQDNGAKPSTGSMEINGYIWVSNSSVERDGKTIQVRNTNRFPGPRTGEFKVERSEDGGATWKTVLQGSSYRTGL